MPDQVFVAVDVPTPLERSSFWPGHIQEKNPTYIDYFDAARRTLGYAESAFSVLQRGIQWNYDSAERDRALDILTEASRSFSGLMATAQRAISSSITRKSQTIDTFHANYFQLFSATREQESPFALYWRSYDLLATEHWLRYVVKQRAARRLATPLRVDIEPTEVPAAFKDAVEASRADIVPMGTLVPAEEEAAAYWRHVRDTLQEHFLVSLDRLAPLVGVAYPTLIALGRKRHHPSTARAVLRLYALITDAERVSGREASRLWFASEGLDTLQRHGFDVLKRAAIRRKYGRQRAVGGISLQEEPNLESTNDVGNTRV